MEVSDVHHAYRKRVVLRGIDLELRPGVLAGIVGENGAGKSTLLKILSGELRPDRGTVRHHGRFGYCPQTAILNDALTIRQHLDFFKTAYALTDLRRAEEVMETLRLGEYLDERAGVLSGGTRQKLNLTLALMHDPQVLLLDEPYQGFDWDTYQRFWDLAARLCGAGRSVLVVSHLAYDAERLDVLWRLDGGLLHDRTTEQAA
ncbi:ABC transporter ATP-binding protein [Streptomyces canus]|uniref:ABC transporter ATP-binding protein n=1 Tax=Streptomyces canus TaxID=58343 RepID=UPI002DDBA40D|nr:ABC transporter ATP-binding protein [Streptomyces canus]WSD82841.1 ABC transporter ATP-binding protein [Streptomyces canus]WSD91993.1 ABC transporter ATP-binding protein [Streptomyces canus]WSD92516.1 ABC transporter ATP-binding protein [Streptomyces canus]